ncbi:MAG: DUF2269 family protein [Candidatus Limnocylindria bacterium]
MSPVPLIIVHVSLAVLLLLPNLVAPFVLRRDSESRGQSRLARLVLTLQGPGSFWIGLGVAVTGIALLLVIGLELLTQPWLLIALGLYAANLVIAAVVARPNLRRLLGLGGALEQETWARLARRQRYLAYAMAGIIGVIGVLMMTKPQLW